MKEMKRYNVLWIDDEFEKQDGFIDSAYLRGIDLACYKTSIQGMEELESKIEQYDAVILDAMVYFKSEDETANLTGLLNSIKIINSLSRRKKIPYFIFSGHIDEDRHFSVREMLENESIFIKSKDNDELFKAIKAEADNQIDTQIRHNHSNVFKIFTKGNLSQDEELQVLNLLKQELDDNKSNIKAALVNIRSVHETIFAKLVEIKVIPVNANSVNDKLKHLSGSFDYAKKSTTTPVYQNSAISNLQKFVHFTSSDYIHNLSDEHYNDYMISAYTVESLRSGLLEILLWFDQVYENNK